MIDNELIKLIYQSPLKQGNFLQLMEKLTPGACDELNEELLIEHMQQSVDLSKQVNQLQQQQMVAEGIFAQLRTAIILLDSQSGVVFCNPAGQAFVDEQKGDGESFAFVNTAHQSMLQRCLSDWTQARNMSSVSLLADGQTVVLSPVNEIADLFAIHVPESAVGAIFVSWNKEAMRDIRQRMRQLYQLTEVEADIASKLAEGLTLDQIAETRSSKTATIRTYTKQIFAKTGTRRQSDLVSLILKAPLQIAPQIERQIQQLGTDSSLQLDDRVLTWRSYGPVDGRPLLLCHPSLGCRFSVPVDLEALERYRLRLIIPDRAGVGASTGAPYTALHDFCDDMKLLLDHLKLTAVDVIGVVAGGAYALALARRCPQYVGEVLLLESFAPDIDEYRIDKAPGYYRIMPRLVKRFPRLSEKLISLIVQEFVRDWSGTMRHFSRLFSAADAQVLLRSDVCAQAFSEGMESSRQGVKALRSDIQCVHGAWPFPLSDINARCHVVHGNEDSVSAAYAEHLLQQLPQAVSCFRPGEGYAAMLYLSFFDILAQVGWVEN